MRITLSYFVESNPARRGWRGRYRHASHDLRFEVKTATETSDQFRARVSMAMRSDDDEDFQDDADQWALSPSCAIWGHCVPTRGLARVPIAPGKAKSQCTPSKAGGESATILGCWNRRALESDRFHSHASSGN